MKTVWRRLVWAISVLVALAILIELSSVAIITISIYLVYGQLREGEPVRYDAYALYLLADGIRPTVHNPPPATEAPIIWMFGGSTTRGISDDDSQTLPSFLARELNVATPVLPARVVNLGNDGYNSLMESKYLHKMLLESHELPRLIIFYDGANDAAYFAQYRTPQAHHGYRQVRGVIESYHASLFGILKSFNAAWYTSFTRELWDKMRQGVIPLDADDPQLQEFVQAAAKRYDRNAQIAKAFGAEYLVLWQPFWWVETAPVAPAVREREKQTIILGEHWAMKPNLITINDAMTQALRDKPFFLDLRQTLTPRQQEVYESDGIHLNPAGDALMAAAIGRILKEKFSSRW